MRLSQAALCPLPTMDEFTPTERNHDRALSSKQMEAMLSDTGEQASWPGTKRASQTPACVCVHRLSVLWTAQQALGGSRRDLW